MSSPPDMDLDLENLFQPAWAQEKPETNRYEKFAGEPAERGDRRREGRRGGPRGESFGERRGPRPPRSGPKFGDRKRGFDRRDDRRSGLRDEHLEPSAPPPEITVVFLPDERGVESLARQIKMTGRAYPLFQIAQLVLQKAERYTVRLAVKKKPDGAVAQPLFVCALDDTPWLGEDEAVAHVLKDHFATFYQAERTATEPPKGTYTFVAQCGMSGMILGPPNHHDYQNRLRKLHAERFARMPFDVFKARVKIVKDEAVVKKWVEEQSFKTEYVVLNVPEPLKLPSLEEVEKHFRATHKETIIKPVETQLIAGAPSRNLRNRELQRLVRAEWEQQRHFPLQLATELSRQFATHGLQFFKVNKTVTHVSVARPQFLDLETTPVSESIKRIIAHINAHPKCTRRQLVETLAPSPPPAAVIEVKPEGTAATAAEPTPEQNAIIADLHWLVHQGHVIEFADGRLETAKKPAPRPPKPEKKPAEEKPTVEGEIISATEPVSPTEAVAASAVDIQVPAEVSPPTVEPGAVAESVVPPPDETTEEAVESPS
ncbi:MAG: hypothetical protein ABSF51_14515 [Verrucomicrobiota bacterium]